MEKSLFGWVWKHSKGSQIILVLITVLSFPILYSALNLPKIIINDALQGQGFPREFFGFAFDQIPYLFLLCGVFFVLVVLNNVVKFFFNTYRGVTGERMLRRLRYDLYERVMRFRPHEYRKASPGQIVQMVTAEVDPLGGYVAEAIATPAFQGGMLAVYVSFIFVQDPFLGAAAVSLYPVQAWVIPLLQRRVIELTQARIVNVRELSDDIAEAVANLRDVHASAAGPWRLATMSGRLHRNFEIRYGLYKRKFLIKFVNNFLNQLTPFLFYSIGGYLVIVGRLDLGALVAVLAAYKDLAGPWKELINYYQLQADMRVRYATVLERFEAAETTPRRKLFPEAEEAPLAGDLAFKSVTAPAAGGSGGLRSVSVTVPAGRHTAVLGADECGRDTFLAIAAGLIEPQSGSVAIGGRDLAEVSQATISRAVAFVDGAPTLFAGTLRDNVRYGALTLPDASAAADDPTLEARLGEARRTGNLEADFRMDWTDYRAVGVADAAGFDARAVELADAFGLDAELRAMGLSARVDPAEQPELAEAVAGARKTLAARIRGDEGLDDVVDFWRVDEFNENASIAENVLFAMPTEPPRRLRDLADDPQIRATFRRTDAGDALVGIGLEVVKALTELLRTVSADSRLMKDFDLLRIEDLPAFERIAKRAENRGIRRLSNNERRLLVSVAMELNPARHRLGVMTEDWKREVLKARARFAPVRDQGGRFVGFDSDAFIPGLSLRDNLLIGKPRLNRRERWGRIDDFLRDALHELDLDAEVKRAALSARFASGGPGLSTATRMRIALIRALIRHPAVLVLDGVATNDTGDDRRLLATVRELAKDATMLYGVTSESVARRLDTVIMIKDGRIVGDGATSEVLETAAE